MTQQQGRDPYQPPYGQQFPPSQYPPPYPGQHAAPRRKRHTGRNAFIVAGAAVAVFVSVAVAVSTSGHQVKTAGIPATGASGSAAAPAKATARIGTAIDLSGTLPGERMSVTVVKTIGHASPGSEFSAAPAGDRLYVVQFRLRDEGSAAYSDAPSNGAAVTDSAGQSYQAGMTDTAKGCAGFTAPENIAPGATGLGCVVFEVPRSARITAVQFTLDSGMGPQTGQWTVG